QLSASLGINFSMPAFVDAIACLYGPVHIFKSPDDRSKKSKTKLMQQRETIVVAMLLSGDTEDIYKPDRGKPISEESVDKKQYVAMHVCKKNAAHIRQASMKLVRETLVALLEGERTKDEKNKAAKVIIGCLDEEIEASRKVEITKRLIKEAMREDMLSEGMPLSSRLDYLDEEEDADKALIVSI
ncbi:MAG: hypothetical protein WC658_04035, partial [Candidatus Omnitrophota bacterium]